MKSVLVSVLVLVVLFLSLSCNEGYDYSQAALGLGLRDFSCTEAWIEVQIGSNDKTANIYIKKNDEIVQTIRLGQSDSLFYFDDLQPNTAYKFDAVTYEDGKEVKSNPVTFTTLDTTSHNFTWQTFTFGQHSSSVLYDVAIINENDIWAVGEIYMNDSLGNPDPIAYNAVHWNGQSWELKKIGGIGGWACHTVFAFFTNDIWFEGTIHWDGSNYTVHKNGWPLMPNGDGWQVNKMWGSSSSDLYAVGNNGNIAHYQNGSRWTKIVSGTTTNINDVFGFVDPISDEADVYCAVSFLFQSGDRKILRIKNNIVDSLNWFDDKRINSIWTSNNKFFFTAGDGVFENKRGYWNQLIDLPPYYSNNIRGNGLNDIFVCGDFGLLSHFNGSSWLTYNEHYMQGILFSIATKNNIVVTVGLRGSKAIIIKGTRN